MGSEVLIPTFPIRNTASAPDCCHVGSFSKSLGLVLSSLPVLLVEVLLVSVVSRGSCGSGAISQRTHGHRYNSEKERERERNGEDMTRRTIESWVLASYYDSRRYISSIKSSRQLYSIMQQNTRKREIKRRTERDKKGGKDILEMIG